MSLRLSRSSEEAYRSWWVVWDMLTLTLPQFICSNSL